MREQILGVFQKNCDVMQPEMISSSDETQVGEAEVTKASGNYVEKRKVRAEECLVVISKLFYKFAPISKFKFLLFKYRLH